MPPIPTNKTALLQKNPPQGGLEKEAELAVALYRKRAQT